MKAKIKSAREIKEGKVASLVEKLERAKTVTFADYRGLSANQIAQLRSKIRESQGEFIVEKNNLIKLSLKIRKLDLSKDLQDSLLVGPTAMVLAYNDEIAPIKEVAQSNKTLGLPTFKFGFFQNDFLNSADVEKLSQIPTKAVLQAKVVGSLNSPIYGIVSVLGTNLKNLVYALNAIKEQKGTGS